MRILVTGSNGTVGRWLTKILQERKHEVFGVDLIHGAGEIGWGQWMADTAFTYSRCDIGDFRQIERVISMNDFDLVYNAAAEFGRWNGEDFYEQVWRTNAIGTKNIIRLQEEYGFKLVHFSSSEVYGDYSGVMVEDVMEKVEVKQLNDYALSKWVNEQQIANSRIQHNTESVIVRLFNTYGPGEFYHPYRSVNCKFIHHALKGLPVTVYRNHTRTSTYLEDTCRTIANIAENFIAGETYNIGGKEHHSIEELVDIVWDYTNADRNLISYRDSEILTTKDKIVDVSKSEGDLNHQNTVSLKDGLHRTIDWMLSHDN
jgi:dTDP-glucose 4,6-dehydratase